MAFCSSPDHCESCTDASSIRDAAELASGRRTVRFSRPGRFVERAFEHALELLEFVQQALQVPTLLAR